MRNDVMKILVITNFIEVLLIFVLCLLRNYNSNKDGIHYLTNEV